MSHKPYNVLFLCTGNSARSVMAEAILNTCPVWPGHPATAQWGFEDLAAFAGPDAEKRRFFERIFQGILARIRLFLALPLSEIARLSLLKELCAIGQTKPG